MGSLSALRLQLSGGGRTAAWQLDSAAVTHTGTGQVAEAPSRRPQLHQWAVLCVGGFVFVPEWGLRRGHQARRLDHRSRGHAARGQLRRCKGPPAPGARVSVALHCRLSVRAALGLSHQLHSGLSCLYATPPQMASFPHGDWFDSAKGWAKVSCP